MSAEKTELAATLSGLLLQAVEDAEILEGTPGYKLHMGTWHYTDAAGTCHVCMAGAVMDRRLGLRPSEEASYFPGAFGAAIAYKLQAINEMRMGRFSRALNLSSPRVIQCNGAQLVALNAAGAVIDESYNPVLERAPWPSYREAAAILAGAGL